MNLHAFRHMILSHARLPIPPSPRRAASPSVTFCHCALRHNFAQRLRCAAAIRLRPAAEIVRAQPVGNLVLRLPRRDHGCTAHSPLIAGHLGRGDVRGLGPLLPCTQCHRFPLNLLSDGTRQRDSCKGDYRAYLFGPCPATWGQLLASAVITSVPLV